MADATGGLHGFPAALTSFVGRAKVVDELAPGPGPGQTGCRRRADLTRLALSSGLV